jgi:formylglycine-generating enzyme required for sulfatase activity
MDNFVGIVSDGKDIYFEREKLVSIQEVTDNYALSLVDDILYITPEAFFQLALKLNLDISHKVVHIIECVEGLGFIRIYCLSNVFIWVIDYKMFSANSLEEAKTSISNHFSSKFPSEPEVTEMVEEIEDATVIDYDTLIPMVHIPSGKFMMGSTYRAEESPVHEVSVPKFNMGETLVTQAQWRAIAELPKIDIDLNPEPSYFKGDDLPVESISYLEAKEAAARLSAKTGKKYRLPSEAEWEYACRGGTTTKYYCGDELLPEYANFDGSTEGFPYVGKTTPVGSYKPNAYGLYDMHGNLWEWCEDVWNNNYENAPIDGSARTTLTVAKGLDNEPS